MEQKFLKSTFFQFGEQVVEVVQIFPLEVFKVRHKNACSRARLSRGCFGLSKTSWNEHISVWRVEWQSEVMQNILLESSKRNVDMSASVCHRVEDLWQNWVAVRC